jgi:hypothetical protein
MLTYAALLDAAAARRTSSTAAPHLSTVARILKLAAMANRAGTSMGRRSWEEVRITSSAN